MGSGDLAIFKMTAAERSSCDLMIFTRGADGYVWKQPGTVLSEGKLVKE